MGFFDRWFGPRDVSSEIIRTPANGTEIRVTATGTEFTVMKDAVLDAVMTAYGKCVARPDFGGLVTIVIGRQTPASVTAQLPSLKETLRGVSLGSMTQGPTPLRFLVQEEGKPGEMVSGSDLMKAK